MAPEYMVRGKLTEKVDIYSFGVVVIEVVLGTKNYALSLNSHSILQKVLCPNMFWGFHKFLFRDFPVQSYVILARQAIDEIRDNFSCMLW